MSRPWRLSPIFWQREFRSLGGQRGRGLEGVIWIQEEMRNRAVLGQEGSPRLAKQQDGERGVKSQEDLEASSKTSGWSGWKWAKREPWSTVDAATASSLLLPHLYFSVSASNLHELTLTYPSSLPCACCSPLMLPKLLKKGEGTGVGASLDSVPAVEGRNMDGLRRQGQVLEQLYSHV